MKHMPGNDFDSAQRSFFLISSGGLDEIMRVEAMIMSGCSQPHPTRLRLQTHEGELMPSDVK